MPCAELIGLTDASFSVDREGRFAYVNRAAVSALRSSRSEIIGRRIWDVFPLAAGSRFKDEYERAMRDQVTVHFEEYYPVLERWYGVHAYPNPHGLAVYFRDITDRKQAEEALRQERDN